MKRTRGCDWSPPQRHGGRGRWWGRRLLVICPSPAVRPPDRNRIGPLPPRSCRPAYFYLSVPSTTPPHPLPLTSIHLVWSLFNLFNHLSNHCILKIIRMKLSAALSVALAYRSSCAALEEYVQSLPAHPAHKDKLS
jgi:hypothetical protein